MTKIGNKIFRNVISIELLSEKLNTKYGWIQVWYNNGRDYEELYYKTNEEAKEVFNNI